MDLYDKIPESAKVTTALGPAALNMFGVPLSEWVLILSICVSVLIIIERIPKVIDSIYLLITRFKRNKNNGCPPTE